MGRARRDLSDSPQVHLSNGSIASIVPSKVTTGFELVVEGTPQSHVDPGDPKRLFYEYVARMGAVIDLVARPQHPITAVHLGAGAMTIPRYIEATRPGSRQQVVEREVALIDLVRNELPLPRGAQIRVRIGDAREVARKLPAGLQGVCDLIVSDIFAGPRTPAHVTTLEFYRELSTLLAPDGMLLINTADGPGLAYARRQVATVQAVFPNVFVLADTQVLKSVRYGNLVIAASPAPIPEDWQSRLVAAGPHPASMMHGEELKRFIAGATWLTDSNASDSPHPDASIFLT
jgi:spermidine synthase